MDQQSLQFPVLSRSALVQLTIRDVVLIERLSLTFSAGLAVLTGETGAGKSILLDALGLALGARGDSALVRQGAEQAVVTAEFELGAGHPALAILAEQGLESDERVIVRRTVGTDGRSRAWINDQSVGVGLLRRLGEELVEVHGQFDTHGLLNPATHRGLLDAYAHLDASAAATAAAYRAWRAAEDARQAAALETERARAEEEFLRHAVAELDQLAPKPGEEAALAESRTVLQHREKVAEAMNHAFAELSGDRGAETALNAAVRSLSRVADKAGGCLDGAIAALDRAVAEVAEAASALRLASADIDMDPAALERLEERLYALRAAARKHGVEVDALAALSADFTRRLDLIEDEGDRLTRLAREAQAARVAYKTAAEALSAARAAAAAGLDRAVAGELAPLKLDRARFRTTIAALAEDDWGPGGLDKVAFEVQTNPGAPPGPLNKIASGGELARFTLALKVVLAETGRVGTLVFDEVDTGIGGAVAAAVGNRLARLGAAFQVLVVTHSPQVAARGATHLQVRKAVKGERVTTSVAPLSDAARVEEIARMLSGATVTPEARAAAVRLIAGEA